MNDPKHRRLHDPQRAEVVAKALNDLVDLLAEAVAERLIEEAEHQQGTPLTTRRRLSSPQTERGRRGRNKK